MRRFESKAIPALALALSALGCGGPARPVAPRRAPPIVVHSADSVRRVCMQMGFGSPGTGGGSIVFATADGAGVDTLRGDHLVVPGRDALCAVATQPMRVCPVGPGRNGGDIAVEDALVVGATTVAKLARGSSLALLEYVTDHGVTKALVDVGGTARFISADEVCHLEGVAARSRATDAFAMNVSVPAGPRAFRPRSPSVIKRIVIHNTEVPLAQTLHHFGRPEANTSAHIVIDRDGTIYRVVEDQFAAFHAGASKDGLGGHNSSSLGIEVVAFSDPKYDETGLAAFFSDAQRVSVTKLVDFWMDQYKLAIEPDVLANRASVEGYADLEYRRAAVTIHRLTKADRGTDCPRLLFPSSPEGDEAFFRWREDTFGVAARRQRSQ